MSSQTFDVTYRLRQPDLGRLIAREVACGKSLRGVARALGVNRKTVYRRLRRMQEANRPSRDAVLPPAGNVESGWK